MGGTSERDTHSVSDASGSSSATGNQGSTTASTGLTAANDDASTGDMMPGETGPVVPPPPIYCSLADIDMTVDPAKAIDAGDAVGLIPTEIGDVLLRNCGCHYSDNVPPPLVDYISDTVKLRTYEDFHIPFEGTLPQDFEGPVYLAVYERVINELPLPMPSFMCSAPKGEGFITETDRALFDAWLSADAPDGANWPVPAR